MDFVHHLIFQKYLQRRLSDLPTTNKQKCDILSSTGPDSTGLDVRSGNGFL